MVLMHILEWGVADPSCMGKGKGTGHALVTVHGCRSACLGLVPPSKHHCLMEMLGSVHLLLLPPQWGYP